MLITHKRVLCTILWLLTIPVFSSDTKNLNQVKEEDQKSSIKQDWTQKVVDSDETETNNASKNKKERDLLENEIAHSKHQNTKRELVYAVLPRICKYCKHFTRRIIQLIFQFLDAPFPDPPIIQAHTKGVGMYQLSWNYHFLASSGEENKHKYTLKLWNVKTGFLKYELGEPKPSPYYNCLFTSNDERLITSNAELDLYTIQLWSVPSGKLIHTFEFEFSIFNCILSHDDKFILLKQENELDKTIQMWSLETFTCTKIFRGHTDQICWLQYRHSGQEVLSSSTDGTIRVWNVKTEECKQILRGHTKGIFSCSLSMNQQYLVSAGEDEIANIWYIDSGENLVTFREHSNYVHFLEFPEFPELDFDGHIASCSFVMKDEYVVSIDFGSTMYVWSVKDGSILYTFKNIEKWCTNSIATYYVKRSYMINIENRECLVLSACDHEVRVVDLESGIDVFVFDGYTEMGLVSGDGRILISAGGYHGNGTIQFWKLNKK